MTPLSKTLEDLAGALADASRLAGSLPQIASDVIARPGVVALLIETDVRTVTLAGGGATMRLDVNASERAVLLAAGVRAAVGYLRLVESELQALAVAAEASPAAPDPGGVSDLRCEIEGVDGEGGEDR